MTALQGAVDATFAAFARRPDTIVGFGETRIHTETATFEVGERRDPDRLVWTVDVRPT